ncbi:oxoglutarate dehydrogenase (succinyl-transferring), E1 component [Pneumocystis murina B123]|uniref:2-oxoglutarate dehydrogenase, mitochondrial n=1 Tax=Pneumocystis murina (strain B123) TaxID=1069680 RepID=M7P2W7_PNEMU|nr:oxoglutarate dehydrogenase (succinyl-transferring), E1 component [Pneumocystis murina B123]EMR08200.1 oxoglutarate dehydrogenase (succinyl-transferring), E1 component [Pneumocystis murina B123]
MGRNIYFFQKKILNITKNPFFTKKKDTWKCINTAGRSIKRIHSIAFLKKAPEWSDSFLHGTSANYIDAMYEVWKKNPEDVHVSWQIYFKNMSNKNIKPIYAFQPPTTIIPASIGEIPTLPTGMDDSASIIQHLKVQLLVRAYQVRGHLCADIDPLGIKAKDDLIKEIPKELTLEYYGFTEKDLNTEFNLGPGILPAFSTKEESKMTLFSIVENLKRLYSGSYGVEYVHIPDRYQCNWLRERLEIPIPYQYNNEEKQRILDRLIWSDSFEKFLATKYPNDKRFGLEGCESLIPGMKALIDHSVDLGIESIVIGMAHRGRLNVLSNVVKKPNESIFSEFLGSLDPDSEGSGDVKYHLGMNYERPTPSGKRVYLSLVANPSHLEAKDPVVLGQTRAIQFYANDEQEHSKSMSILLHGDAAFAAQGVVYETMGFHSLPKYSTGGTIHLIINNQIGFTTDPRFARSTPYCSDIAKSIDAPIFHVNGDDVEALVFICKIASEWRATFKKDVVIDIVCYRRHGHNETDQPSFTQPLMYRKIIEQTSTLEKYAKQLIKEGSFSEKDINEHKKCVWDILESSFKKAKNYKPTSREWLTSAWNGFASPRDLTVKNFPHLPTSVDKETLKNLGRKIFLYPKDFNIHPNLKRIIRNRALSIEEEKNIDWATGEALAFATLLMEGCHVRLSGQDVERGTFSQRHAVLHDQENEDTYIPLNFIDPKQAKFVISNSSLSEFGVLGFEYGYSLISPNSLVVWEAQFGDFANNAQCIIDQFIASAEVKWRQRSGIILSLPHGYDGQGPEHSSGRIERYLQLVNDDYRVFPSKERLQRQHQECNIQIAYPTTPANLFHLLRRQIHREFRKPLIMFFSKSLLRHPLACSNLSEFSQNSHFQRILDDPGHENGFLKPRELCNKLILCTGQIYVSLYKERQERKINDTAIVRCEQIHPFHFQGLKECLDSYPNLKELIWCQEEPLNAGAWQYIQPRLKTVLRETQVHKNKKIKYVGRLPSASVATGNKIQHKQEHEELIRNAFESL